MEMIVAMMADIGEHSLAVGMTERYARAEGNIFMRYDN